MKHFTIGLVALAALSIATPTTAYNLEDAGLVWKAQHATIVVIGRVLPVPLVVYAFGHRFISIQVESVLKGSPPKVLSIALFPREDMDIEGCCRPDGVYLFFLWKLRPTDDTYESVDGRYGVYPMNESK